MTPAKEPVDAGLRSARSDDAVPAEPHKRDAGSQPSGSPDPVVVAAAKRREERKENIIAILIVLLVIAGIVWFIWARTHQAAPADQPLRVDVPIGDAPVLGTQNATHVVVLFTDFACPFCSTFALESLPVIEERYVRSGQARIVFKHFPLSIHPDADGAARAAACAQEQGLFWEYHDVLFAHQDALDYDSLVEYAGELAAQEPAAGAAALNESRFVDCLARMAQGNTIVDDDRLLGQRIGVTGTPTFFFDGIRAVGALSPDEFGEQLG
jgi:protein-disulfide isomerase